jgi:hypothetical protein
MGNRPYYRINESHRRKIMTDFTPIGGNKVILDFSLQEVAHLSNIKRWAIARMNRTQSVAEHSYNVAMIAGAIVDAIPSNVKSNGLREYVINWALVHDLPEVYTGDIPTPMKKYISEGVDAMEEAMFPLYAEMKRHKSDEVSAICKAADIMEATMYCRTHCDDPRCSDIASEMSDILGDMKYGWRMNGLGHVADAVETLGG